MLNREFARDPSLKEKFLAYYNGRNQSNNYISDIYKKEFLPHLEGVEKVLSSLGEKSEGITELGLKQVDDYKDPDVREKLMQQEEISMLGSVLMGKWRNTDLYSKLYDRDR